MRNIPIGVALVAGLALTFAGPLLAQPRSDPNLDPSEVIAPSQMMQSPPPANDQPNRVTPKRSASRPAPEPPADDAAPAPASPPAKRTSAPAAHAVACNGVFAKDSSNIKLAMVYETKNVTLTQVDAGSGAKVAATILFAKDPKRRLEVWWANEASSSDTYLILINGQSTWTAPGGMRLGLSLAQLEKLNHKSFKLKGFDKDGVAAVSDWGGGELGSLTGGCKYGVTLRADPKAKANALEALSSGQEYNSSDAAVRAVKPAVSEILIGY
jgi:hypothetical protein